MQMVSIGMRTGWYVDELVSNNPRILQPVPVSTLGRLFTEKDISFRERRPEAYIHVGSGAANQAVQGNRHKVLPPGFSVDEQLERQQKTGLRAKVYRFKDGEDFADVQTKMSNDGGLMEMKWVQPE